MSNDAVASSMVAGKYCCRSWTTGRRVRLHEDGPGTVFHKDALSLDVKRRSLLGVKLDAGLVDDGIELLVLVVDALGERPLAVAEGMDEVVRIGIVGGPVPDVKLQVVG